MIKKFIDNIRNKHELIFKVILFLVATILVVLLFPKEAKFKYEFQKNKPWVHQDLLAPFDFAINKTEEEINSERQQVAAQSLFYFNTKKQIQRKVGSDFQEWLNTNWKDTLELAQKEVVYQKGLSYFESIYTLGVIEVIDELDGKGKDYTVLILDENNVGEERLIGELYTMKSAYNFVQENLKSESFVHAAFLLSGIENNIQQNIRYNRVLSEKDLENEQNYKT